MDLGHDPRHPVPKSEDSGLDGPGPRDLDVLQRIPLRITISPVHLGYGIYVDLMYGYRYIGQSR